MSSRPPSMERVNSTWASSPLTASSSAWSSQGSTRRVEPRPDPPSSRRRSKIWHDPTPSGCHQPQIWPAQVTPSLSSSCVGSEDFSHVLLSRVLVQGRSEVDMVVDQPTFRGGGQSKVDGPVFRGHRRCWVDLARGRDRCWGCRLWTPSRHHSSFLFYFTSDRRRAGVKHV
jgi:hypothetical protein